MFFNFFIGAIVRTAVVKFSIILSINILSIIVNNLCSFLIIIEKKFKLKNFKNLNFSNKLFFIIIQFVQLLSNFQADQAYSYRTNISYISLIIIYKRIKINKKIKIKKNIPRIFFMKIVYPNIFQILIFLISQNPAIE